MGSDPPRVARRRAFTLIELLVVIGVILILINLVLIGLQHAERLATRTQCASNLRQIGLAFSSYGKDYHRFPTDYGHPWCGFWYQRHWWNLGPLWAQRYVGDWQVFYCPETENTNAYYMARRWNDPPPPNPNTQTTITYDYGRVSNLDFDGKRVPATPPFPISPKFEVALDNYAWARKGTASYVYRPHRDGSNVVYGDAHVEFVLDALRP